MDLQAALILFIGIAALAAKPGPGMVTVATKAIGEGLDSVIYFMVGTNLVKIFFFVLVVFGYHILQAQMFYLSTFLKALGTIYLLWLGIKGLVAYQTPNLAMPLPPYRQHTGTGQKFWDNFSAGVLLTIGNPFDILFFSAILPSIFDLEAIGFTDFFLAALVIIAGDACVALAYATPLAMSRKLFTPALLRKMNLVASIGIIAAGLYIGWSATMQRAEIGEAMSLLTPALPVSAPPATAP
jgi:threonine/homoserine/homoserine lactone efflux protein